MQTAISSDRATRRSMTATATAPAKRPPTKHRDEVVRPPLSTAPPAGQAAAPRRHGGFAAMEKERQRAIASKGGRAAHESGHAHKFTPEEARIAGRKGGELISRDRAHMSAIGRKGGSARGRKQAPPASA